MGRVLKIEMISEQKDELEHLYKQSDIHTLRHQIFAILFELRAKIKSINGKIV